MRLFPLVNTNSWPQVAATAWLHWYGDDWRAAIMPYSLGLPLLDQGWSARLQPFAPALVLIIPRLLQGLLRVRPEPNSGRTDTGSRSLAFHLASASALPPAALVAAQPSAR